MSAINGDGYVTPTRERSNSGDSVSTPSSMSAGSQPIALPVSEWVWITLSPVALR